jgi:tetratricopeptide (TPR) repeat protein
MACHKAESTPSQADLEGAPTPQAVKHALNEKADVAGVQKSSGIKTTLRDLANAQRSSALRLIPYVFYSNRLRAENPDVILIDKAHFWALARPGDTVLLSDRVTHHYTMIVGVDREKEEVEFGDPWPEQFFLLEGKNEAGVKARLMPHEGGNRLVRITRNEFSRVVVGLLSVSGPDLAQRYLQNAPAAKADFKTQLALGLTMLYAGDGFVGDALCYLREAVSLADAANEAEGERFAASRLVLCVLLQRSHVALQARGISDPGERQKLVALLNAGQEILNELEVKHQFKQDDLLEELLDGELFRLGRAALAVNLYQQAAKHFTAVIQKNATHEEAHLSRAQVKGFLQDFAGAVDDATVALQLIDTQLQSGGPDESERNLSVVVFTPSILKNRKIQALTMRAMANHHLQRIDDVIADARQIIELEPNSTDGYILAGNACLASDRLEAARDFFRQGLDKESNPVKRDSILEVLRKLEPQNDNPG